MFDWFPDYVTDMNDEKFYQKVVLYLFEIGCLILLTAVEYINNTFKENVLEESSFSYILCVYNNKF